MLQYLIILLDNRSVSYCHYRPHPLSFPSPMGEGVLIPLEVLKAGIVFAMKENLNIQFVYPEEALPVEYTEVIESIDHTKIKPMAQAEEADVLVLTEWQTTDVESVQNATCIISASRQELNANIERVKSLLNKVARLNIVLTDIETFCDEEIGGYQTLLETLSDALIEVFKTGRMVQLNLLTDRLLLTQMNNCGAGDTTVTLAPNGKFYLCPAFYYDDPSQNAGSLADGLNIKNRQLLRLNHAPICRHCDAYQCKRCIWLNSYLTLDANTPSHQQCVIAHIERNASRDLLAKMEAKGLHMSNTHEIPEINYLDPFNNYQQWK